MEPLGPTLGLATRDLASSFLTFIQWLLGLVAFISTIMFMLAGFVWLTAGGDEERKERAKRIIRNAIVGYVIVGVSWAIVLTLFEVGSLW